MTASSAVGTPATTLMFRALMARSALGGEVASFPGKENIAGVKSIVLTTDPLDATARFYRELLELPIPMVAMCASAHVDPNED